MPHPPEPAKNPNHRNQRGGVPVLDNGHEVQLATFSDRAWARSTDAVNLCLVGLVVLLVALVEVLVTSYTGNYAGFHNDIQEISLNFSLWLFLFLFINETVGVGTAGRTLGKKKYRIRVVNHNDGETPSSVQAFLRSLIPNITGAVGSIIAVTIVDLRYPGLAGLALWILIYLSATLTKDRRGWHDKIAGTVVIKDPKAQPNKPNSNTLPETTERKSTQSWGMVSDYYTKNPPQNNKPDNSNPT